MKIKLAILEPDQNYVSRLIAAFNAKYPNTIEVYSYCDLSLAIDSLKTSGIDMFIASKIFDVDVSCIPDMCAFAYMVDSPDIESYRGQKVIFKFQKIEAIYKQVLRVYSEKTEWTVKTSSDNPCNVVLFSSPCGGTGTSTVAVATALRYAGNGKKVLYLNLESLGATDVFLAGNGRYNLSDGIFAVKSNAANLAIKLDGYTKRDDRGIYFFSAPQIAFDVMELNGEEILRMIETLKSSGMFEYIIVDRDFGLKKDDIDVFTHMDSIVWVGDGSAVSNEKLSRAYNALGVLDGDVQNNIMKKTLLILNKFNGRTGTIPENVGIPNIGGIAKYEDAPLEVILYEISKLTMLDKII